MHVCSVYTTYMVYDTKYVVRCGATFQRVCGSILTFNGMLYMIYYKVYDIIIYILWFWLSINKITEMRVHPLFVLFRLQQVDIGRYTECRIPYIAVELLLIISAVRIKTYGKLVIFKVYSILYQYNACICVINITIVRSYVK